MTETEELAHMRNAWTASYAPFLPNVAVPVSKANFAAYGCSSVPTVVLIDRAGVVVLYHPGRMTEDELTPLIARAVQ